MKAPGACSAHKDVITTSLGLLTQHKMSDASHCVCPLVFISKVSRFVMQPKLQFQDRIVDLLEQMHRKRLPHLISFVTAA